MGGESLMAADRSKTQLVEKILGDPSIFPDAFKAWLPRYLNGNINVKLNSLQLPTVETIHYISALNEVPFVGTWVPYAGGYEDPGYYKDPFARVQLSGMAKSGTSGTVIFNLPSGYRPKARVMFVVLTDTGIGRVDVLGTGDVQHVSGGTGFVPLNGISFRAYA
jgi:hypothetical protein